MGAFSLWIQDFVQWKLENEPRTARIKKKKPKNYIFVLWLHISVERWPPFWKKGSTMVLFWENQTCLYVNEHHIFKWAEFDWKNTRSGHPNPPKESEFSPFLPAVWVELLRQPHLNEMTQSLLTDLSRNNWRLQSCIWMTSGYRKRNKIKWIYTLFCYTADWVNK